MTTPYLSRRGFIVTSLATGFAMAASPLLAQVITTDTDGLKAGEVMIPVAGATLPAYRALPAKPGNYPVVLVIQEIFGVHEHIKDMCRRFAKLGYYAIAPELFARQGDVSKLMDIGTIISTVVAKVPDAQVMSDLDATLAFAKASGQADGSKLGMVGYCWGGRIVWLYAHHNPRMTAGVAYYGRLEGTRTENTPTYPMDIASTLTVPVLGLYAGNDNNISLESVAAMRANLAKSASGSEIIVFPGATHGFNADYRASYDKSAATYAWHLAQDWLKVQ